MLHNFTTSYVLVINVLHLQPVLSDLCAFGERVANEVDGWGRDCEVSPPSLIQFDSWGRRVDYIQTSAAWKQMKDLSAQEGLVSIGYERHYGEWRLAKGFTWQSLIINVSNSRHTALCVLVGYIK